ncbi:archease [Candidatus Bathyarchaeota archaeon]|jgi:SHS2 domain-containing protein|nr:archease [Candidatus Bathyarchaeota archaeon]MDP6048069.1 archease [Candidatus Bathyarchaeota archaeon]MDP6458693.1 archease [Candidatus Bathyarchaeota archaeon]MDP7207282.1 archease [Candidatus Bathyarchaeota archaeon]MDP7443115.1 archease [Candidatus Bathyarchaeota archaeon]|tara:strand:+ start:162 stop:590 length:429 start_codon:yes stop_codon:yes gene_type:complete
MTPGFSYAEDGPTADLTVDAWGGTLDDVFQQSAIALFNAITPIEGISRNETREFEVEGHDLEALLFNFLDELLYLQEIDLIVFSGFDLEIDQERFTLKAVCHGESFDLTRHTQGIAIKAVTFHMMKIEQTDEGWNLRVVLDT